MATTTPQEQEQLQQQQQPNDTTSSRQQTNSCDPHESNDVLLLKKAKTGILEEYPFSITDQNKCYYGNKRFLELLTGRLEEYQLKPAMERPMIAVELLKQWRSGQPAGPPGRFLVAVESDDNADSPPSWKDLGDKDARSRISKALKNYSTTVKQHSSPESPDRNSSNTSRTSSTASSSTASHTPITTPTPASSALKPAPDPSPILQELLEPLPQIPHGQQLLDSDKPIQRSVTTTTSVSDYIQQKHHSLGTSSPSSLPPSDPLQQQLSSSTASCSSLPPLPTAAGNKWNIKLSSIAKPHRLQSRRISAQLHTTIHQKGKLYGRYKEQELMKRIYQDTAAGVAASVNLIVIKGPRGVGKSALARTYRNHKCISLNQNNRPPMYHVSDDDDDDEEKDDLQDTTQGEPSTYFYLESKFEQLMNPNPYKVFVDIANQICQQLLSLQQQQHQEQLTIRDKKNKKKKNRTHWALQQFQTKMKNAFSSDDLEILMDLIPSLRQCYFVTATLEDSQRENSAGSQEQQNENRAGSQQRRENSVGERATTKEQPTTKGRGGGILLTQKVKSYFVKLLQVTMSISIDSNNNNPMVVVLNDMHWSSEASLDIWTSILSDIVATSNSNSTTNSTTTEEEQTSNNGCGIIFVATVHEDENCDGKQKQEQHQQQQQAPQQQQQQYFAKAIEKLQQARQSCTTAQQVIGFHEIRLKNLQENDVQDFLMDTLDTPYDKVKALASHIWSMSNGNPMFVSHMLPRMQHEGFIYPDPITGDWSYDLSQIKCYIGDAKSTFDIIRGKISELPADMQMTLKCASSLGNSQIDTSLLELLLPPNQQNLLSSHLEMAMEFGFLNKQKGTTANEAGDREEDGSYYFPIDGIRHMIYSLIPETERPAFHLSIAQKLWNHFNDDDARKARQQQRKQEDETEFLYILLNQLMLGDCELKENGDRHAVATLCLRGGQIAAKTLGFQTAWVYLEHGISILPSDKLWGRENYDLSLQLHNAAVEVCYCNAKFDLLDELIQTILTHSRVLEDSLVARSTQIFALGSRHKLTEAVNSALATLKELGEVLPASPTSAMVTHCYRKTKKMLQGKTDESIIQMLPMTDRKKLSIMQIYNHMFLYASSSKPSLAALVAMHMVQLTLESGISSLSSVAFSFYAEFLVGGRCIEEGLRWGKLGMKLYDKFKNEAWLARVFCCYYGVVSISKERISNSLDPLRYATRTGLRTGDIEYSMRCGMMWICTAMGSGNVQLPVIKTELERLANDMKLTGHTLAYAMLEPIYQIVVNLSSGPDELHRREEFLKQLADANEQFKEHRNVGVTVWYKFAGMASAVLFGDFELAKKSAKGVQTIYSTHGYSSIMSSMVVFFECMIRLQQAKRSGIGGRLLHLSYVKKRLKLLKKWAFFAPENILDKYHILAGQFAAVENHVEEASLNFRAGILHATTEGRHGIAGIGNELLARLFLEQIGDRDTALPLLNAAKNHYLEWGAKAKVTKVEKFHDSLAVGMKDT